MYEFPSFLHNKGRQASTSTYQELVDGKMNEDLQAKVLNTDYDDHGMTEDFDYAQTHSNQWI